MTRHPGLMLERRSGYTANEWAVAEAVRLRSARWFSTSDPAARVGTRHHTVPAFCLRRFADGANQLAVWRRTTHEIKISAIDDVAIKDFYTVLSTSGEFDGRMEDLLGQVEDAAADAVKWLLSPFRGRELPAVHQLALCTLIAFQMMRGPRKRKEIELLGDYGWKLADDGHMTDRDRRETVIVPHPNEHIRLMGSVSEVICEAILRRPVQVILLDAPLLVICDEPVLVDVENHVRHLPECALSKGELIRRERKRYGGDGSFRQPVHVWPTRPAGVIDADALAMPISPTALIALGPAGVPAQPVLNLAGDEARELAAEVNAALVAQAYEWVAASPGHPDFRTWRFPALGPLLGVCDGGSIMSQQLQTAPVLRWQRIRKDWATQRDTTATGAGAT